MHLIFLMQLLPELSLKNIHWNLEKTHPTSLRMWDELGLALNKSVKV